MEVRDPEVAARAGFLKSVGVVELEPPASGESGA